MSFNIIIAVIIIAIAIIILNCKCLLTLDTFSQAAGITPDSYGSKRVWYFHANIGMQVNA